MRSWVVVACVGFSGVLGAQSFDCKLAKSAVEKAVCGSKELSAADSAMAAKYKQVLAAVPVDVQAEVRVSQRSWLHGLGARCKSSAAELGLNECLASEYKGQMKALSETITTQGGMTFVMRSIELLAKDDADDPWLKEADIAQNAGYSTLEVSWPQALSSDPHWVAWNAAVLAEVQKMAGSEGPNPTHKWKNEWAEGSDGDITSSLSMVGTQILSVAILHDMMGHGAAHPNESYETFHWMLKEQRPLKVSDVFVAGSAWEKVVSARCRASLKEQVGDDYQDYAGSTSADFAKTLTGIIADPQNWDIDAKGLTISFPEYSVTPRMQPVDPVTVPWSALQAFLAKGFVVPR